jgi:predicted RNA-binding protein with PIN domain
MALEPTLYLFDGYNLLHAGAGDDREQLVDLLASFVAGRGARGVVVFDGAGEERRVGRLEVRYAAHADDVIERLAAERRLAERVAVVSSDAAIRETAGPIVERIPSREFARRLAGGPRPRPGEQGRFQLEGRLDDETRAKLEEWRRRRR